MPKKQTQNQATQKLHRQTALMKPAFKVVRRRRQMVSVTGRFGGLILCSVSNQGRCYVYSHDFIQKPMKGDGPLTVFRNQYLANLFVNNNLKALKKMGRGTFCILPCLYKPSRHKRVWTDPFVRQGRHLVDLPVGTILADAVILTKE